MKKKITACILATAILLCIFCVSALADTGPKPSVIVKIVNLAEGECWGTLLSSEDSTGPASVWDGTEEGKFRTENEDIWQAFVNYKDADGYYFLQRFWNCGETKSIDWTYYPPNDFKVLLYYPETDEFAVSEKCSRYAFHSYFTADASELTNFKITADETVSSAVKDETGTDTTDSVTSPSGYGSHAVYESYDCTAEIVSFVARLIICIALEMSVAVLFGFKSKHLLLIILSANVCTQLILNIALGLMIFKLGTMSVIYLLLELFVLAAESVIYICGFKKAGREDIAKSRIIIYTIAANIVSFAGGLLIARFVPSLF